MKRKIDKKILCIFIVCLFLEVFIFNMNSYRVLNRNRYERKSFTVDQMETTGFEVTGNILTYVKDYGEEASVTIKNIDTEVGTLYLDLYLPNESYLAYTVYYTDEANRYLMRNFSGEYVQEVERTKWVTCHFSGKTRDLKVVFDLKDDLYQMAVNVCTVNEPVKFRFSLIRFLSFFLAVTAFYLFREHEYFRGPLRKRSQLIVLGVCTAGMLLILWNLYAHSAGKIQIAEETGDMYSQKLTDALLAGQAELDVQVSDQLLALDNLYDETERTAKGMTGGEDYIIDAACYQGNYYVYFGVVPALLFFVPFKWITGLYLSTGFLTCVLFGIYLVFLNLILIKSMRNMLSDTPFSLYILGILLLDAGSVAFSFVSRARFYEMAYGAGLAFAAAGLYLLLSIYWKRKINYVRCFLGGLFLALSVGCRPTMVLYSFLLLPYLADCFLKKKVKENAVSLAILLLPYVLTAVGLMWYNYIRFGNVFDFGQNYQLTVTDMAKDSYKPETLPLCFWFGMFQPFSFSAKFPFVLRGSPEHDFPGYFYNPGNVIPMFSSVPLLYSMFIPKLWKEWKKDHGTFAVVMLGTAAGIGWLMAAVIFVSAGVHLRYTAEAIPLFMNVAVLLCCNYIRSQEETVQKKRITVFYILTLFSVLTAFLLGLDWIFSRSPEFYFSVERIFSFWK